VEITSLLRLKARILASLIESPGNCTLLSLAAPTNNSLRKKCVGFQVEKAMLCESLKADMKTRTPTHAMREMQTQRPRYTM
jgi:hypothetical protein